MGNKFIKKLKELGKRRKLLEKLQGLVLDMNLLCHFILILRMREYDI
jgi:hypothetical protein